MLVYTRLGNEKNALQYDMVNYIFDEYFFSKSPPSISPIKTSFSCLSFRERERERERGRGRDRLIDRYR